jgi:hypothetical protein
MEIGNCVILDNGYKVVLSDISGTPASLPATFKIYDSHGSLLQTLQLYAPPNDYYRTQYGFSIDVQNIFHGIGQTAYAQVYVRSWSQYNELMQIGDSAYFQGLRVTLTDISAFPTGSNYPIVHFKAFNTQGQLVTQFDLQRGQTVEVKINGINGLVVHLLTAFAGIGQTAYATVGFTGLATSTPTPVPTATITPCSNDVYARCADGHSYLQSKCVSGQLQQIKYFADPCLRQAGTTPASETGTTPASEAGKPTSEGTGTFSITLHKGWNLISTPLYSIHGGGCTEKNGKTLCTEGRVGVVVTSTTCSPATLWHHENGQYADTGKLGLNSEIAPFKGYWANAAGTCELTHSGATQVSLNGMRLSKMAG